jgi:hypothetical protein
MGREREADDNEKIRMVFPDNNTLLPRLLMVRETFTACVTSCW